MNSSIFFLKPQPDGFVIPEPSIYQLVLKYYEAHVDKETALECTTKYFTSLVDQAK